MRFTIEEINNSSSLLPNITLGYEIYDVCSESANMYATLGVLAPSMRRRVEMISNFSHYQPRALAVIGPHSSGFALTSATILSIFLMPQISYEASTEMLSLKHIYPSFLRTIPSDRVQVEAMVLLMQDFRWNWVAMVGSDTDYGRKGIQTLYKAMTKRDICVAYRGLIPANKNASSTELKNMVRDIVGTKVNVTIVFSDRRSARVFFEVVVQENVTGKVWVGTENWLLAPLVSDVPGIYQVGTVIGMSVKASDLEAKWWDTGSNNHLNISDTSSSCNQLCTQCHLLPPTPDARAMKSSYNVYSAVYAVAHGLHSLLGCNSGACRKDEVYPWQLLQKIKQVNFSLHKNWIYFDVNGDPMTGYDLIMWKWTGPAWSFDTIGSFSRNPDRLSIDWDRIVWHTEDNQVPRARGVGQSTGTGTKEYFLSFRISSWKMALENRSLGGWGKGGLAPLLLLWFTSVTPSSQSCIPQASNWFLPTVGRPVQAAGRHQFLVGLTFAGLPSRFLPPYVPSLVKEERRGHKWGFTAAASTVTPAQQELSSTVVVGEGKAYSEAAACSTSFGRKNLPRVVFVSREDGAAPDGSKVLMQFSWCLLWDSRSGMEILLSWGALCWLQDSLPSEPAAQTNPKQETSLAPLFCTQQKQAGMLFPQGLKAQAMGRQQ
ncbi:taste receptor type 1 member 1 isoform X3 [Alligator sinensis]|uniref:Taste receptor type 1 member 1 isoform X3 n=1 Tax=Alligator sinensis TaxID=38654 RepID=A0A3Q0GQW7_ALLSI|nr:taste receptor type 1 member 1 isoform X3 [Alligator sinensis]